MKKIYITLLLCFFSAATLAMSLDKATVLKASEEWANAVSARDVAKIVNLYDKKAILYGTFSNMLDTPKGVEGYFQNFTKHPDLHVIFNKQRIMVYPDVAINSGLYTFTYKDDNKIIKIPARYTFVYIKTNNGLRIVDHHSSVRPECMNKKLQCQ